MKKLIRKLLLVALAVCALITSIFTTACTGKNADGDIVYWSETTVVITVTKAEGGATLQDAMQKMQADEKLSFVDNGGMIIQIYDRAATGNEFWALFSSLEDYTSEAWGTCAYEGTIYNSAMLGYAAMPAVVGALYIWRITVW